MSRQADIPRRHSWKVTCAEARAIQERLAAARRETGLPRRLRTIAGADVSYDRGSDRFFAAVLLLSFPALEIIAAGTARGRASFPYVPGYLTFREGPILLRAFDRLTRRHGRPDAIVFDGQGLAHPRRFGIACHLGVLLDVPSIGCAKSRLIGEHDEPGAARGSSAPLRDGGDVIGAVLRTRTNVAPVYVSVGHRVRLRRACRICLEATRGYRLPEPTRQAHLAVNRMRRGQPALPP